MRALAVLLAALPLLMGADGPPPPADVAGAWEGAIVLPGGELGMRVVFTREGEALRATIDIPAQGAAGLALTEVRFAAPAVHFELPAGPGLAVFDGTLESGRIAGSFVQAGFRSTFTLRPEAPRPASPPPPYREEAVTVSSGEAILACTLSVPPGEGRRPAMAFLSGSGPQTRDEDVFGFKVFALLSDPLVRKGIVTLRCDDRGVGQSTGGTALDTTETLAADGRAMVRWLAARPEADPARTGLLGHSEGTIAAGLAALAAEDRPDFRVLLAAPGVTGEQLLLAQAERLNRAAGTAPETIAANAALQRKLFAAARTGEGWDAARAEIVAMVRAQGLPEAQAAQAADAQVAMARSPWMRWFLDHDPAADLARVPVPTFVALGGKDLQVPADQSGPPLEKALAGKPGSRVQVFPEANHLFQAARTGGIGEYGTLPREFVPGLVDAVAGFVLHLDSGLSK